MIHKPKVRLGLASLLGAACLVLVVAAWADSQTDRRSFRAFEDVVRGLAEPEQMHLVADVLIAAEGEARSAPPWTTTGRYEYWQAGERFRISARVVEPDTPLAADMDVSWDGHTFYLRLLRGDRDILSLGTELPDQLPVALPHPLMLSLESFSEYREDCAGCLWIPASLREGRLASKNLLAASRLAWGLQRRSFTLRARAD